MGDTLAGLSEFHAQTQAPIHTTEVSLAFSRIPDGWRWEFLRGKLLRAALQPENCRLFTPSEFPSIPVNSTIVCFGEEPLRLLTGKRSIDKWHLSPLRSEAGNLVIPTFDVERVQKQYELSLYVEMAFRRARESQSLFVSPERFLLNPSFEETLAILDHVAQAPRISVDVETGYGQINTVGFAWSPSDAVAINVLPDRLSDENFYELWRRIARVLESPSEKVFQNFIYDTSYFAAYGIRTENIFHDTMLAMKVLWPELDMGLDNVGRIYTNRPYWKDDGRTVSEEGKRRDWGNIRDWTQHYIYNCRDTTGTFEACGNQIEDLRSRGLFDFYNSYIRRLFEPVLEMCTNGMPVSAEVRSRIAESTRAEIETLQKALEKAAGKEINPSSPKQVLEFLREQKVKIPKKFDRRKGESRESTDAASIKKIRLKYPDLPALKFLADVKKAETLLSRYIDADLRPDGRLGYSLIACGTETLRMAGGTDPWSRGFNIQTIPRGKSVKQMFVAPEGWNFVEVDLRQAESRFVAYDSADATLIDMLESGADVHRYVAAEIFRKRMEDVTKDERQLGKKAGHGANYAMKEGVFIETCFSEMDLVLSRDEARNTLESYHRLFPGIRRWHQGIRDELARNRKLTAPSGWERYFYGRLGDDMFKEAYAWRPQHTIPWITNHLMLKLVEERERLGLELNLHVQVHDSLILTVSDESLKNVAEICLNFRDWHPKVTLSGGTMWIPTEVKWGRTMADLKEWGE